MNTKSKLIVPADLQLSSRTSAILDFVRGMAALIVMLQHLRALLFVDYVDADRTNIATKFFYLITALGHQAVIVFFVLSGFFISSSIFRMHQQHRWSWREYLVQRIVRLWVVLIPALLLTAFWDYLGIRLFGDSIYRGLPSDKYILGFPTLERLNVPTFLGNLLFLQGITTPTFGSNGPLWSLSYEFWYYIAFPCALLMALSSSLKMKAVYGCLLLAIGLFVGKSIALAFLIWLLGVAINFLPFLREKHRSVGLPVVLISVALFSTSLVLSTYKKDFNLPWLIGLSFALLIYLILRYKNGDRDQKNISNIGKFSKAFAGFSYSLYLTHLPPLVFLHAYLNSISGMKWQPTMDKIILACFLSVVITLYAWFIALLTEFRTATLRRFIKQKSNI